MKKLIIMAYFVILSLSAATAVTVNPGNSKSDKSANKSKKEYKLSDEEVNRLTKRVEEIRHMDKSKMTVKEKRDLRKELRTDKRRADGYIIYVSSGTVLLIVLIILLV